MVNSFKLLQPTTIAEASAALGELGESARIYSGGAELLLLMRHNLLRTETLIDIKKIARLSDITFERQVLRVGACVTHRALETNQTLRAHAPALAYAESQVGNVRVRNQGTLGGNLCFNDPHSDPATVLLIHEATVVLANRSDERRLPVGEFLVDMYATALQPDELLLEVQIPALPRNMRGVYTRLHRYQRPTIGIAAAVVMDDGTIGDARVAVGCVGPKPQRLVRLEKMLAGCKLDDVGKLVDAQKGYVRELLSPVDDLLGSADYKVYMTGVLVEDAVKQAAGVERVNGQ